jgi:Bacterial regulatory proteins, gntR family
LACETLPYRQVAADLRAQIERGELTATVPSITTLMQTYGVARNTARKALLMLADQDTCASCQDGARSSLIETVKGAVRSLHEALMGGCLRVVDEDFLPVYRQPAVAKDPDWHLAVVTKTTRQGRATHVTVTEDTAWVPVEMLHTALGRVPRTGDTVDIEDWAIDSHKGLGREEVTDSAGVTTGDGWTVLVGDSGTRGSSRRFFCAAGRMPADDADTSEVAESAWSEYVQLCDGTNDLKLIRQKPDAQAYRGWRSGRAFADVRWGGQPVQRAARHPQPHRQVRHAQVREALGDEHPLQLVQQHPLTIRPGPARPPARGRTTPGPRRDCLRHARPAHRRPATSSSTPVARHRR